MVTGGGGAAQLTVTCLSLPPPCTSHASVVSLAVVCCKCDVDADVQELSFDICRYLFIAIGNCCRRLM